MTEADMRNAVMANDGAFDGQFFYAVKTTNIYCRPSCKSRTPNPQNLLFFQTAAQAQAAGFRPCKRCRPDLPDYRPAQALAQTMRAVIEETYRDKPAMFERLKRLPVSQKRALEVFRAAYGETPGAVADGLRIAEARRLLAQTDTPILDVSLALGFESLSAFYAMFGKVMEQTPAAFRRGAAQTAKTGAACVYQTALGPLTVAADAQAVTAVRFGGADAACPHGQNPLADQAAAELTQYFAGERQSFSVPLRPAGTPFQREVWNALLEIPYGETRSYAQIARRIGRPAAARAVGAANRGNPIAVLIPCHRVVGADGALTGYAAGLPLKRRLLELEQNLMKPGGR